MVENETGLAEQAARAMRELASTVTEAPPLRLSPRQATRASRTSRPVGQRGWRLWGVPLTAAVAVIALAVALVTIRDLPNGRADPPTAPSSSSAADVPTYYATPETICNTCQSTRLVVGDTFTGAKLASFEPPRGTTFEAVSAAADDRTFVADTVGYPFGSANQHAAWYLLKITPGASSPVRLTRLPIPAMPPGTMIGTVVLSPSGGELAVTYQFGHSTPTTVLRVYSVATGKLRNSWSTTIGDFALGAFDFAPSAETNNQLRWVDGSRALSFATISYTEPAAVSLGNLMVREAVRTLNLATGSGDLIRDSRVIWSRQTSAGELSCADGVPDDPWVTANGKTIVCADVGGDLQGGNSSAKREAFPMTWLAFQTSEPKVARTLYTFTAYTTGSRPEGFNSVEWADASGSTLIVAWFVESTTFSAALHFGVISDGRLTPLPTPPGNPADIAW